MKSLITNFQSLDLSTHAGQSQLNFKIQNILDNLTPNHELVVNEIATRAADTSTNIGTMQAELGLLLRNLLTDMASNQTDIIAELQNKILELADHSKKMLNNSKETLNNQDRLESAVHAGFTDASQSHDELKSGVRQLINTSKTIATRMDKAERERLLNWLSSTDPSLNYNSARQKHESCTGDWLIHDDRFQSWFNNGYSFLWLHGKGTFNLPFSNYCLTLCSWIWQDYFKV
jgi:hypothetical protein